jgi:hypothetical protein
LSHAARAQNLGTYANSGDLILGFTSTHGNDYIVDVGMPILTPGAHTTFANGTGNGFIDASAIAQVQSTVPGMFAGAISSDFGAGTTPPRVFTTTAHGAAPPNPLSSAGAVNAASSIVSSLSEGVQASSGQASWQTIIAKSASLPGTSNPNNFVTQLGGQTAGVNPLHTFVSSILVEDVWNETLTPSGGLTPWQFLGVLTMDLSGSSPNVFFDAASPVPEPGTYGVLAGLGLLALSLRKQLAYNRA